MIHAILSEARIVVHRILIGIGSIYILSAILLLSPMSTGIRHMLSYIHVFSFFPTLLFLGLNTTLLFLTMKDVKTSTETAQLPKKNIISGVIAGVISIGIIIWLLLI